MKNYGTQLQAMVLSKAQGRDSLGPITRVGAKVGIVPHDVMGLVEDAIRLQMALN